MESRDRRVGQKRAVASRRSPGRAATTPKTVFGSPSHASQHRVRLYTFSGQYLNVGEDGSVEMSAEDAKYLIRAG
jgi:hypothetical protein